MEIEQIKKRIEKEGLQIEFIEEINKPKDICVVNNIISIMEEQKIKDEK